MYENVEEITLTREEYDNLIQEREEYRSIALELSELLRGGA